MSDIGLRLKEWRANLNATQVAFAMQIGVDAGQYRKYEQGRTVPGGEVLTAIAKTGVNLNWLLTGEGPMRLHALPPTPNPDKPLADRELLRQAVHGVERGLAGISLTVPPDARANLICAAYDLLLKREAADQSDQVEQFIKQIKAA
jgi:transcriptional regulator with XRE-family HTH domain